ncbi:PIN domain-containing protein [Treponema sp.]|uniref:PIN domain-containing protein n=1 Tax=Treponema sp. TaxID=166 RepID=UPI003EFED2D8
MQVLIDTNVVLDVLLDRKNFVQSAVQILKLPEDNIQKYVSASAITDIHYIAYKEIRNKEKVKELLLKLIQIIHIADVSEDDILSALNSDWNDFEDSVQNAVAESHKYDVIITRNKNDYNHSNLKVLSPEEFLTEIGKAKSQA